MSAPAKEARPHGKWKRPHSGLLARLNTSTWIGLGILAALVLSATFAPLLATHDPLQQSLMDQLLPPGSKFLLGSDDLGRDIWSRLLYGARYSLAIGFLSIASAMAIGTPIG
ncbi:MAG: hypothetical protein ABIO75_00535, partial [Thermomonas sp.]